MTTKELLQETLLGRLLIVGEYRGSRAEEAGYVDKKSGEAISYVRAIHLIECACRGNLDRAMIYERLPEIIEKPEEAAFHYLKGRRYVFFLVSMKWDKGQVIGSMAARGPELIEGIGEGSGGGGGGGRRGAGTGPRP
jgi:hypothetical protein